MENGLKFKSFIVKILPNIQYYQICYSNGIPMRIYTDCGELAEIAENIYTKKEITEFKKNWKKHSKLNEILIKKL